MATQTDPGHHSRGDGATSAPGADTQAKAQQAAGQAQEKAQAAAGQAQAKLREQLDQRSGQLAEQVHQQTSDLRSVSETLRDRGKDRPAQVVDRLVGYAQQIESYLRDNDADAMLGDAEEFGRRKPGAVAAGAFGLGLVASRFLKASSSRRYSARQGRPSPIPSARTGAGPVTETALEALPGTSATSPARSGV